jgi:general secretion pathway protein D
MPFLSLLRQTCRSAFTVALLLGFVPLASFGQMPPNAVGEQDLVDIQLPNNPVTEVIGFYEMLTGRRLIRDANLAGPNLSIMVTGRIPRNEAISLIESALILNGYSLVPVDDTTTTVLGPGRSPLGQSIPLYADPFLLPSGEVLVSYFMLLNYISPPDALAVFGAYVSPRPHGTIVAVPNSNALVITDTTTLVRRLVALQRFIDVPGARTLTEFIPLSRANAETVAEIVNKLLEEERQGDSGAGAVPALEGGTGQVMVEGVEQPAGGIPQISSSEAASIQKLTALIKVIPDTRTNRILVVAPENRMSYLQRIIMDLDASVDLEQILERPLRFVSAGEILPILQSTLAEGNDEAATATPVGGSTTPGGGATTGGFTGGGGTGTGGTGGGAADLLSDPREDTSPLAVSVGKTRIIADRSTNSIIVIGPPDVRAKAAQVIDLMDQRPKQIYLATVIGQLTLRDEWEVGFDYLVRFQQLSPDFGGAGLLRNRTGTDILPDPSALIANNVFPALSGLTLYGTIAESVDIFARLLARDTNFKIISRPVVYTANNKRAVISSGQEVPVPTSTTTSAIAGDSTALTSNIGFKDVVLKLEVIPLINSDDEVTLTIAQQNNAILEFVEISQNRVPVIGTQRLTTTITVKDRSTIVLGGLITEEDTITRSGVPVIKDIPGLNYLFGSTSKNKIRRELIILIQPFIIKDHGDLAEAQQSMREASRLDDEIQEMGSPEVRRAEPIFPVRPIN